MSSDPLLDINPVLLTAEAAGEDSLALRHEGEVVDEELIAELDTLPSTTISIADFHDDGDGLRYRVNVSTIEADGTLSPWPRSNGAATSPVYTPGDDELAMEIMVDAISYDAIEPLPERLRAAATTRTRRRRIRIKIRKKGLKPLD